MNYGVDKRTWIVAEIGLNHDGDVDKAIDLVSIAARCGADAVKVQAFSAECFVTRRAVWNSETQFEMFQKRELPKEAFAEIANECRVRGLEFFGTPDCVKHAEWLVDAGASAIKVGSDDFTNHDLIADLGDFNLPMILSTGMATREEVVQTVGVCRANHPRQNLSLLYCCSSYPAPIWNLRLLEIPWLRYLDRDFIHCVGFSDHTTGDVAAALAVSMGAKIVEKHLTRDNRDVGPDHSWSADPITFSQTVNLIRVTETALKSRDIAQEEIDVRIAARRSVVAAETLEKGLVICPQSVAFKRPGDGLPMTEVGKILGKRLKHAIIRDELITVEDVE